SQEDDDTSECGADASITDAWFLVGESRIVMSADLSHQTKHATPQMSGADLKELEEVKRLIARGLRFGVLTYAEIAAATAELGLEDTDVEELHGVFERCEIELIEEIDPATAASLIVERAPEKRIRRKAQLDLEPD